MFENLASATVPPVRPICHPVETARRARPSLRLAAGVVASALAAALPAAATDGDLDTSFRSTGKFLYQTPSRGGRALAFRTDGTPLVGYTVLLSGTDRDLRVLPVPDSGFTTYCISLHPDLGGTDSDELYRLVAHGNRLYVGGAADGPAEDPETQVFVAALDRNTCQIDSTFAGPEGRFWQTQGDLWLEGLAVTPNGSVRVAASHVEGFSAEYSLMWKGWNATGGADGTFTAGLEDFQSLFGALAFVPSSMVRQPDGKLVIAGTVTYADGDWDVGVVRLTAAGLLDSSFGSGGLKAFAYDFSDAGDDRGMAVAVLPDRRIVVAGVVERTTGNDAAVAVLTPSGAFDGTFGFVGRYTFELILPGYYDNVTAVTVQGDGKILVAGTTGPEGYHSDTEFAIARLHSTGASPLDTSFHLDGVRLVSFDAGGWLSDGASAVALDPQGRIVVSGYAETAPDAWGVGVARLENSYIFAESFEWGSFHAWSSVAGQ